MGFDHRIASPAGFARHASHGRWKAARHLVLLNRIMMAAAAGEKWASRVIIQMPPRHGKSEFVSGYFPAWFMGLYPDRKVMMTSYGEDLAVHWGQQNRDLLAEHGPDLFGVRVRQDSSAKNRWLLQRRKGTMTSAAMGGILTGRGGHMLIVDDPIKNDVEALSPTTRERHKNWYRSTFRTRLEQPGAIVVIQTRWHQDDLAGWLQREDGEDWLVISLPAIAEQDEAIYLPDDPQTPAWTRRAGEALWPEMHPLEELLATQASLGGPNGHWWLALYQQRPSALGGGILKPANLRTFQRVSMGDGSSAYVLDTPAGPRTVRHSDLRLFSTMDLAASIKTQADYTVIGVFGADGPDLLALDVLRGKWEGPDLPRIAARVYEAYRPSYIGVESVGFQVSTVQDMRRGDRDARPMRPPLPVKPLNPQGDKVSRALTLSVRMGGGNVYVPQDAKWLPPVEAEMAEFPRGSHDDTVDVFAYAALEQASWQDGQVVG